MKIITETERLIIREIGEADVEAMLELHSDPEVHKYLGNKTISSIKEIKEIINFLRQQYEKYKVGRWAMIDKNSNEFIGWTGIEYVTKEINGHKNYYDLGYRLKKQYWGKGYATESAIACLEYAFNQLQLNKVYAMADYRNKGSNNILKKSGMSFIETFEYEGVKHHWYKIEKVQ
ncbi:MAG: GNAT family N-acetyltransferase [Cyclobacteriaceae bacterium]|nr:GNAT family N-acetyltransferase [Cyclobacteriaceae bacterium]